MLLRFLAEVWNALEIQDVSTAHAKLGAAAHGNRADDARPPLGLGPADVASAKPSAVDPGGRRVRWLTSQTELLCSVSSTTRSWEEGERPGKGWKGGERRSMTLLLPLLVYSATAWSMCSAWLRLREQSTFSVQLVFFLQHSILLRGGPRQEVGSADAWREPLRVGDSQTWSWSV